jgi:hypothetical protein
MGDKGGTAPPLRTYTNAADNYAAGSFACRRVVVKAAAGRIATISQPVAARLRPKYAPVAPVVRRTRFRRQTRMCPRLGQLLTPLDV